MTQTRKRRIVNGIWYEVCVVQEGEIRDVIVESSRYDAERRADAVATQWSNCERVFIREHRADPASGRLDKVQHFETTADRDRAIEILRRHGRSLPKFCLIHACDIPCAQCDERRGE